MRCKHSLCGAGVQGTRIPVELSRVRGDGWGLSSEEPPEHRVLLGRKPRQLASYSECPANPHPKTALQV